MELPCAPCILLDISINSLYRQIYVILQRQPVLEAQTCYKQFCEILTLLHTIR